MLDHMCICKSLVLYSSLTAHFAFAETCNFFYSMLIERLINDINLF